MKHIDNITKNIYMTAAAVFCSMLLTGQTAMAADELVDKTSMQLHGEKLQVELWGNRHDGGYIDDLLLLLKNDKKIITAFNPSVNGGYNLLLQTVQIKPVSKNISDRTEDVTESKVSEDSVNKVERTMDEQVLLSAGQGDWQAVTEYRIIDFSNREDVKELFNGTESMGLVKKAVLIDSADGTGKAIDVELIDGEANQAPLAEQWNERLNASRLDYGGLTSLTVHDIDQDGQDELFTNQRVRQRKNVLADVAAVWKLQDSNTDKEGKAVSATKDEIAQEKVEEKKQQLEKKTDEQEEQELTLRQKRKKARQELRDKLARPNWKQSAYTIMTAMPITNKQNKVNDGLEFEDGLGVILSHKIVIPNGEASYPVYVGKDIDLKKSINEELQKGGKEYLDKFYDHNTDVAFSVMRADDKVLSVQYISSTEKGFIHHNVNIDMKSGKTLALDDVLDTKNPDLLAVLRVLKTNDKVNFDNGLPKEWYFEGNNLYFVQNVEDKDETAGFAMGNLHKFVRDTKWLEK